MIHVGYKHNKPRRICMMAKTTCFHLISKFRGFITSWFISRTPPLHSPPPWASQSTTTLTLIPTAITAYKRKMQPWMYVRKLRNWIEIGNWINTSFGFSAFRYRSPQVNAEILISPDRHKLMAPQIVEIGKWYPQVEEMKKKEEQRRKSITKSIIT